MNPMPSLAGTDRDNAFQLAEQCAMFARVNALFLKFIRQHKWSSAAYADQELIKQLELWQPNTAAN